MKTETKRNKNIAPETRQLLSEKMNAYFRKFGVTRADQEKAIILVMAF